jgi:hypothetical protein
MAGMIITVVCKWCRKNYETNNKAASKATCSHCNKTSAYLTGELLSASRQVFVQK